MKKKKSYFHWVYYGSKYWYKRAFMVVTFIITPKLCTSITYLLPRFHRFQGSQKLILCINCSLYEITQSNKKSLIFANRWICKIEADGLFRSKGEGNCHENSFISIFTLIINGNKSKIFYIWKITFFHVQS